MEKDLIRMQMLAGVITESEYQDKIGGDKLSEEEYHNIELYMNNAGYRSSEGMDDVSYHIDSEDLIIGIDRNGYYALDDKTNEHFYSLSDVIKFYNL
jgi:hypothetical protein